MSRKPGSSDSRVLELLEATLRQDLRAHADAHAESLGAFQFAEAAARSLESAVEGREGALRQWLAQSKDGLDLGSLRLFHAMLDVGRQEYSHAAQAAEQAQTELEASRGVLIRTLQRRAKLQDLRQRRSLEDRREEDKRQAAELDALWLQSRYHKP